MVQAPGRGFGRWAFFFLALRPQRASPQRLALQVHVQKGVVHAYRTGRR